MTEFILETRGLTKHYGGVHALTDATFTLARGEHVAIMGDNGAGKSTFVRQITGVEQPTGGQIVFDGVAHTFDSPIAAREAGIETVFQTLALADDLDVPSNLFLGREKILFNLGPFSILDRRAMREAAMAALVKTGVKIPNLLNSIRNMSGGQRQCVAIARTAAFKSKLVIMDEPTAALGVQETAQVQAPASRSDSHLERGGRAADPDQPQHAPSVRSGRPHRCIPARQDCGQSAQGRHRWSGCRVLYHGGQDRRRIRRRCLNAIRI